MRHLDHDDLVLQFYGESPDPGRAERHLAGCESCAAEYERLRHLMSALDAAPVAERPETYGEQVWQRVQRRLEERPTPVRRWSFGGPRLALAGALGLLLVAAFLLGRWDGSRGEPIPDHVRERILLVAVGDHLERSQRLLVEIVNARDEAELDLSTQQARAERLVADNRLYRQTASRAGDASVTGVLEDLERVLLEIANGPADEAEPALAELQRRIARRGILVKVRVIGEETRKRGRRPAPRAPGEV